ncbi:hypothetical protein P0D75_38770 [Paraburkholderia sediminicola]|uniref:hypothetical protein n=1 Tax=Paraburkholderia sediminicola TaxID=458836 RepID=UPI0038BDD5CC
MADAHVVQITHTAALMCSHLPLTDGFDLVAFLDRWQDLSGAIIGGMMGVVGALIVASRATRRERRIAASALLPELMSFRALGEHVAMMVAAAPPGEMQLSTSRKLVSRRPKAIVLHSPALNQLSDIDPRLYSHLFQCQLIHREFEDNLRHFSETDNAAKAPIPAENVQAVMARLILAAARAKAAWDFVVEHSTLAEYYLNRFIFRRWPVWAFSLRMRFFPNDFDRRSAYLLKTGDLPSDKDKKPPIDEDTPI